MKLTIISFGDLKKEEKSAVTVVDQVTDFAMQAGGKIRVWSGSEWKDYAFDLIRINREGF